jgi:hypothetical protein
MRAPIIRALVQVVSTRDVQITSGGLAGGPHARHRCHIRRFADRGFGLGKDATETRYRVLATVGPDALLGPRRPSLRPVPASGAQARLAGRLVVGSMCVE